MNTPADPNYSAADAAPASAPQTGQTALAGESLVIPVIQEQAFLEREVVTNGRVRLTKLVHEHEEPIDFTLQHDEVLVERVPVNQFLADDAALPMMRYEGEVMIVPVLREVVVKRMLIVEELRVTKKQVATQQTQTITLRQEELRVERLPGDEATTAPNNPGSAPAGPTV